MEDSSGLASGCSSERVVEVLIEGMVEEGMVGEETVGEIMKKRICCHYLPEPVTMRSLSRAGFWGCRARSAYDLGCRWRVLDAAFSPDGSALVTDSGDSSSKYTSIKRVLQGVSTSEVGPQLPPA